MIFGGLSKHELQSVLLGGFKHLFILPGEMIQFWRAYIFQMSWNHQLGVVYSTPLLKKFIHAKLVSRISFHPQYVSNIFLFFSPCD